MSEAPVFSVDFDRVAESVWVCLGILVEEFAGRRFSHQSSPFWERSNAAPCGTDIIYIKLIVIGLFGLMRGSAGRCGGAKITFRVRCIQPGSATSPQLEGTSRWDALGPGGLRSLARSGESRESRTHISCSGTLPSNKNTGTTRIRILSLPVLMLQWQFSSFNVPAARARLAGWRAPLWTTAARH